MKVALTEHTSRPWRIHEIAHDFEVEDVWALPTPGGPDDFELLTSELTTGGRPGDDTAGVTRLLWAARWKLGEVLGWDRDDAGLRARVPTLRDRLPDDLREAPRPELGELPFSSLYKLDDEFAAELANATVHAVLHLGWVEDGNGRYRGQMAVLVKPNGLFGRLYMAAIKPLRYLFIYPAMMRNYERYWQRATGGRGPSTGTVTGAVGLDRVPESMRGPLDADYADIFTLATDVTATPDHCARTMFEDVAGDGGQRIWRRLLGLRLAPRPWTDTVAGWSVAERGDHWIRLQARSRMLTFNLVVRVGEGSVTLVTLGRYDRLLGRILWSLTSRIHRRAAPGLLRDTARKLR
ncbi:DUF2867 domain-containing protein [Actinomadura sp. 3N407]|uniref:DUF2867 domain-containing protein n=1 Tax=Actinomadura sp. 3N407 TaxID=3457423 RepID=UPI003FCE4D57